MSTYRGAFALSVGLLLGCVIAFSLVRGLHIHDDGAALLIGFTSGFLCTMLLLLLAERRP